MLCVVRQSVSPSRNPFMCVDYNAARNDRISFFPTRTPHLREVVRASIDILLLFIFGVRDRVPFFQRLSAEKSNPAHKFPSVGAKGKRLTKCIVESRNQFLLINGIAFLCNGNCGGTLNFLICIVNHIIRTCEKPSRYTTVMSSNNDTLPYWFFYTLTDTNAFYLQKPCLVDGIYYIN